MLSFPLYKPTQTEEKTQALISIKNCLQDLLSTPSIFYIYIISWSVLMASNIARRLEGKVALITGAARGIGEATARLFSEQGAKVVIADVLEDLGEKVSRDLGQTYVHCDVTKESHIENAVDTAVSKYGKLDIMYNNAGIVGVQIPNILDIKASDFEYLIRVNLVGPFLGIKHAARVMIPNRSGSIISTASVCSTVGGVASHAYTSSKHGVVGLTRNAAVELGRHGIRVNCVSPYLVPTPLAKEFFNLDDEGCRRVFSNLKGTDLTPKEVAQAALYLAGDESKYVSGHNLLVDGGFTIVNPGLCMYD